MMKIIAMLLGIMVLAHPVPALAAQPEPATGYIFLGDSRTVGMDKAAGLSDMDDTFVVAECGMGFDWMMETGLAEVSRFMDDNPEYENWILVINLGINDVCGGAGRYLEAYNKLKDVTVYAVSVNPCNGDYECLNSYVSAFNSELEASGIHYIDTCSILMDAGFKTRDGLHYDSRTYRLIFDIIADETGCGKDYEGE